MSRAIELAKECGAKSDIRLTWYDKVSETKQEVTNLFGVFMTSQQIEAFYHAARAEALREAADFCETQSNEPECPERAKYCAEGIRAMADREGK